MAITLDGTNGITTPDLESTGPIIGTTVSGTTGTFSGAVQASGVATNLYPLVSGASQTAPPPIPQYFEFTGIPSWVKRITVMFSGVSTSGTDAILLQLGDAGGIEITGYVSVNSSQSGVLTTSTSAFIAGTNNPATDNGNGVFTILQISTNAWVQSGVFAENGTSRVYTGAGSKTLSDTLTQVRITTTGGTNTFDAGTINILYE